METKKESLHDSAVILAQATVVSGCSFLAGIIVGIGASLVRVVPIDAEYVVYAGGNCMLLLVCGSVAWVLSREITNYKYRDMFAVIGWLWCIPAVAGMLMVLAYARVQWF